MDLLFIGGILNRREYYKKSRNYIQNAANVFQNNIIDGIIENQNRPLKILNSVFIGSYPYKYEDFYIKTYEWKKENKIYGKNVGFINIEGIKQLSRSYNLKKEVSHWSKKENDEKVILIYSMHLPFLIAARESKRLNKNVKVILVVPDLPLFMRANSSMLYKIFKKIDNWMIFRLLSYVDGYVLLTHEMASFLNLKKSDYIVIEGMINSKEVLELPNKETKRNLKTIVYTGGLNLKYGIPELLEAFSSTIDSNYRLIICGAGDAEDMVIAYSKKDQRIQFKGLLSREEVIKIQNNATCLINPRMSNDEFVKYSFPSKTMEYLLSGTPTIAYKLPGIPEDYDSYLYYIENSTVESLKNKIVEIINKPNEELVEFGLNARSYVVNNKNNTIQTKRILDFINKKKDDKFDD